MKFLENIKPIVNTFNFFGLVPFALRESNGVLEFRVSRILYVLKGLLFDVLMVYATKELHMRSSDINVKDVNSGIIYTKTICTTISYNLLLFWNIINRKKHIKLLRLINELDTKFEKFNRLVNMKDCYNFKSYYWELFLYSIHSTVIMCLLLVMYILFFKIDDALLAFIFPIVLVNETTALIAMTVYIKILTDIIHKRYEQMIQVFTTACEIHHQLDASYKTQLFEFTSSFFCDMYNICRIFNRSFNFPLLISISNAFVFSSATIYTMAYITILDIPILPKIQVIIFNILTVSPFVLKILFLGRSCQRLYEKEMEAKNCILRLPYNQNGFFNVSGMTDDVA